MRHANLPIFVPNLGCPHRCSFCDQQSIAGAGRAPTGQQVAELCRQAVPRDGVPMELAFFGGSFTALPKGYMMELLEAAAPYLAQGKFSGVRLSTRPDAIDRETLQLLRAYGVTAVELGAQSMDPGVLEANLRGHSPQAVEAAAAEVRAAGFELGLQMMTGLYRSSPALDRETARRLAALGPDTMRIYPTLALEGTLLGSLARQGIYRPQTLEEAVELTAGLLDFFEDRQIRVIRVGLHPERSLEESLVAGPYHPAFRELCEGRRLQTRLEAALLGAPPGRYRLSLRSPSKITGHGGEVLAHFREMGYNIKVCRDGGLPEKGFRIHPEPGG